MKINKPTQRVRYELQIIGQPTLEELLKEKFSRILLKKIFFDETAPCRQEGISPLNTGCCLIG